MPRGRGEYKAGDRVSFRIGINADDDTLEFINSLENFSEEIYTIVRDAARVNKMKGLIKEHENKFHKEKATD